MQVTQIIKEIVSKEDGLYTILEIILKALMKSERNVYNQEKDTC